MGRVLILFSLLLLACSSNAAEWLESSSDHFVIYSDQDEKAVRGFSERLELFHAAMGLWFKVAAANTSPSNRVTIFVVSSPAKVRELGQQDNRFVAGLYNSRAGNSIALVPKRTGATDQFDLQPETILYHEYAHHFMAGLTSRSYPRWFNEGFAEFFSGVRFRDDSVGLGTPAQHRAVELAYAKSVPIRTLLDYDGGYDAKRKTYDAFYGQSWLLFHYLQFAEERAGQLSKYGKLLATGDTALEAAEGAFGDLDQLEKDMDRYRERRKLSYLQFKRDQLPIGPVNVRVLRPGEAEIMITRIKSKVGVKEAQAQTVVTEARRIAALYPDDPAVLSALAEAEFDSGNDDAAITAADRAVSLDATQVNAYIQKGYAMERKARGTAQPKPTWKEVRAQWIKANKAENDHPIPLVQYYFTYLDEGIKPTKTAVAGLEWAMTLAPFDPAIRWQVAQQMVEDERLKDAADTLQPLAYSPHPGEHTEKALKLLKELEERMAAAEAR